MKTLKDARVGETVTVAKLDGAGALKRRIMDMGVTKGTELCVKPEQAFVVTQILEAIYESAKTGKPVYLD